MNRRRRRRNQVGKTNILIVGTAFLIALMMGTYLVLFNNIEKVLVVQAGSMVEASDFKKLDIPLPTKIQTGLSDGCTKVPGEYKVEVSYCFKKYYSKIQVVDSVRPILETKDIDAFAGRMPEAKAFVKKVIDGTEVRFTYVQEPDMTKEGEQIVKIQATDLGGNTTTAEAKVNVIIDTVAPVIDSPEELIVLIGIPTDITTLVKVTDDKDTAPVLDFMAVKKDESEIITADEIDQTVEGEYTVTLKATDGAGNETEKITVLKVVDDKEAPRILGVQTKSLYLGSTISYRKGIVVEDNYDAAPKLSIDSSAVDLSKPGVYDLVYSATDAIGNVSSVTTTVTVKEKPDTYVEEEIILAEVDKILEDIIKENMTTKEKVNAVYDWITAHGRYRGTEDKNDRLQAAYVLLTTGIGDCYNFYALSSVMLDQLNIPNVEIKRSPNSVRRSRHWWNLVSIDGGETYYHFDTCPQYGCRIRVCLSNDATLEKCNKITAGYYTYDKELYPVVPDIVP